MSSEILWPHSVPIFSFGLKYIPFLFCELTICCWTTTDDFLLIRIRISDACYDASERSLFSANRTHQVNSKMFKPRKGKWSPDLNKMLPWGKAPNFVWLSVKSFKIVALLKIGCLSKCWTRDPWCEKVVWSLVIKNVLNIWICSLY